MKGVIGKCLEKLVIEKHGGREVWQNILTEAGLSPTKAITISEDMEDAQFFKIVEATSKVLGITQKQAFDAFGDYWSTSYAPVIYQAYFVKYGNAREFLLALDSIHDSMTKSVKNAHPPRFKYEESPQAIVMIYQSPRGMIDLMVPLARGILKKYNQQGQVTKLDNQRLKVEFAN